MTKNMHLNNKDNRDHKDKKVADHLQELGIAVYCPMITQIRQWSDRKKKVAVPLISSYLFVQLEEKQREAVFQVPGVVRYLFWLGKPAVVTEAEIETLKRYLKYAIADVRIDKLQPGDKIDITDGYFKGKEGIVTEVNKNRLQLLLVELGMKITLLRQEEV